MGGISCAIFRLPVSTYAMYVSDRQADGLSSVTLSARQLQVSNIDSSLIEKTFFCYMYKYTLTMVYKQTHWILKSFLLLLLNSSVAFIKEFCYFY